MTITLTRHADVVAVLADPRFDVLAAAGAPQGLAWLRGAVSRFRRGSEHTRRRALAEAALATVPPTDLRAAARTLAGGPTVAPHDVPVAVLAAALGAPGPVAGAVATITPGYFSGVRDGQSHVDDAVRELVDALGGAANDVVAARIGLLVQAHDATGRLVETVLAALRRRSPSESLAAIVAESLRHDPPVPVMRRECLIGHERPGQGWVGEGEPIVLDVVAANRDPTVFADPERFDPARPGLDRVLTFGAGPRACPGREHALALAIGTLEGVTGGAEVTDGTPVRSGFVESTGTRARDRQ
jgi:cytochrome P450